MRHQISAGYTIPTVCASRKCADPHSKIQCVGSFITPPTFTKEVDWHFLQISATNR